MNHLSAWLELQKKIQELDDFIGDNWVTLKVYRGEQAFQKSELVDNINDPIVQMHLFADRHIAWIDEQERDNG